MHDRLFVVIIPDEKTGYEKSDLLLNVLERNINECIMQSANSNDDILQKLVHHEGKLFDDEKQSTTLSSVLVSHAMKYSTQMQLTSALFGDSSNTGQNEQTKTARMTPSTSSNDLPQSIPPSPARVQKKKVMETSHPTSKPPSNSDLPTIGTEMDSFHSVESNILAQTHTAIPFSVPSEHTPPSNDTAPLFLTNPSNNNQTTNNKKEAEQQHQGSSLSYELRVYEALFTVVLHMLRGQYNTCLTEANKVLDKLSTVLIVSVTLQEQMRMVKDTAVSLHTKCEGYCKLLDEFLQSEDDEFAYLYLSELSKDPELYR